MPKTTITVLRPTMTHSTKTRITQDVHPFQFTLNEYCIMMGTNSEISRAERPVCTCIINGTSTTLWGKLYIVAMERLHFVGKTMANGCKWGKVKYSSIANGMFQWNTCAVGRKQLDTSAIFPGTTMSKGGAPSYSANRRSEDYLPLKMGYVQGQTWSNCSFGGW